MSWLSKARKKVRKVAKKATSAVRDVAKKSAGAVVSAATLGAVDYKKAGNILSEATTKAVKVIPGVSLTEKLLDKAFPADSKKKFKKQEAGGAEEPGAELEALAGEDIKPLPMPDINDEAVRKARRRAQLLAQARGGRLSTILTDKSY
jgi:hypothetical protein